MSHANRDVATQGACILVVDDHAVNCELVDAMLTPHGYRVEQAVSGRDALKQIELQLPDLILLDVSMPGMDGFEVARRLRAQPRTRLVPIIMVTAVGEVEQRVRGLGAGADEYVVKPVETAELLARVQSLLRQSYLRSQVDERQKLELVLGDVSDGIVIVDAGARVREASPSARRLLGLAKAGDGQVLRGLWGDLQGAPGDLHQAVRRGEPCDFVLERKKPALFLAASLRPVRDPAGTPTGAVLSLRDVTRDTLERRLQEDVMSVVNHKFRTPLTVSQLWAKLLVDGDCGPVGEQQRQALQSIYDANRQLQSLLDGMLAYAEWQRRLQKPRRTVLRFAQIAAELRERTVPLFQRPEQLVIDAHNDSEVVVDAGLFMDALLELVRNAVKFAGEAAVEVRVTLESRAGRGMIEVHDNGPGIPPEVQLRIFEPFYQAEEDFTGQVKGLGLGLAMVKATVESMGAELELESQLGRGTKFTILL